MTLDLLDGGAKGEVADEGSWSAGMYLMRYEGRGKKKAWNVLEVDF